MKPVFERIDENLYRLTRERLSYELSGVAIEQVKSIGRVIINRDRIAVATTNEMLKDTHNPIFLISRL